MERVRVTESHDRMDRVNRTRLVESGGARDDSPSWNLGCAKQGGTIRADGTSPRSRRQEDVKTVHLRPEKARRGRGGTGSEGGKTTS